eukprot:Sdes_comp20822_c0_seq11m17336
MLHFAQTTVPQGSFSEYDFYTQSDNWLHYCTYTPFAYNISNLRIPVAIFSGSVDKLATPADVGILNSILKANSDAGYLWFRTSEIENYGHGDLVWGSDVDTVYYPQMLEYIEFWRTHQRSYPSDVYNNEITCQPKPSNPSPSTTVPTSTLAPASPTISPTPQSDSSDAVLISCRDSGFLLTLGLCILLVGIF